MQDAASMRDMGRQRLANHRDPTPTCRVLNACSDVFGTLELWDLNGC